VIEYSVRLTTQTWEQRAVRFRTGRPIAVHLPRPRKLTAMQIKDREQVEGGRERITVVPESVDDLWHLQYVLEPGDRVAGDTTRRIQRNDDQIGALDREAIQAGSGGPPRGSRASDREPRCRHRDRRGGAGPRSHGRPVRHRRAGDAYRPDRQGRVRPRALGTVRGTRKGSQTPRGRRDHPRGSRFYETGRIQVLRRERTRGRRSGHDGRYGGGR